MNLNNKDPQQLLQRSFTIGIVGIILCFIPLINNITAFADPKKIFFLNGFGLAAQFMALSLAILVIRKRKIPHEIKDKSKRMIIVLSVSILFFFLNT
ncbi:hypothetical protein KZP23_22865 [Echinicola marina]|uniref:hypothetical protein n=1 Tax=Echinicola marina TaxID=2859768 RepID=UPI001CF62B51|nr:hypothetical protein [Echinicola marina]UCS93445.1 hypothetical protein KZP23_22865 [Echinicola marina]